MLLLPVPWVSLLPDGGENIGTYSGPENCACCSLVASLPCCSLRGDSTHGISHTERHLLQKKKKKERKWHVHICTRLSLWTDSQTLLKLTHTHRKRCWNMYTAFAKHTCGDKSKHSHSFCQSCSQTTAHLSPALVAWIQRENYTVLLEPGAKDADSE